MIAQRLDPTLHDTVPAPTETSRRDAEKCTRDACAPRATPDACSPAPASPRGKLNLGGIKTKTTKSDTKKPHLPDSTGELGAMIDRIRQRREEMERLEGSVKLDCADLAIKAFPHYLS